MPIKESVTIDEVIEVLNRALAKDRGAISELFLDSKIWCNEDLANDETIQVAPKELYTGEYKIGILGIINGMFGIDDDKYKTGYGPIVAEVSNGGDGEIVYFERADFLKIQQGKETIEPIHRNHKAG